MESVAVVSESVNGRPRRVFILGDMGLKYGNEKWVCTPFDVILAFFVSVLIVLKFIGKYGKKAATFDFLGFTTTVPKAGTEGSERCTG